MLSKNEWEDEIEPQERDFEMEDFDISPMNKNEKEHF